MTVPYDSGTFYADNDLESMLSRYPWTVTRIIHQMKAFHDMLQQMDQKIHG